MKHLRMRSGRTLMWVVWLVLSLAVSFMASCLPRAGTTGGTGGVGGADTGGAGTGGAGADKPTLEEQKTADDGGNSAVALGQAMALADSLFKFDSTLDPALTAGENASAIQTNT